MSPVLSTIEGDLILTLLEKETFLMANLQIQQYPEKMMDFGVHWEAANAELGGTPETEMQLKGGYDRAQFLADRDAVSAILEDVEDKENDWQGATFDRDQLRIGLRDRVMQFRKAVQLYLADSRYERMLPDTPQETAAAGRIMEAARDAKKAWQKVDADTSVADFTPPLVLRGGYDFAAFSADVDTMEQRFDAVVEGEGVMRHTMKQRDDLLAAAWDRMVQYRQAAQLSFDADHALLQTLPDLTTSSPPATPDPDPDPGTPDGVPLSVVWDSASMSATLSWTASEAADLVSYRVLYAPGPAWDETNASEIAQLMPNELAHTTAEGLANPGDVALFRVDSVLASGDEQVSNVVSVENV